MTCAECDADIPPRQRVVTLVVEYERTFHFCSDRCERRWLIAERARFRAALNRIYTSARISGRAREIAHVTLTSTPDRTNQP